MAQNSWLKIKASHFALFVSLFLLPLLIAACTVAQTQSQAFAPQRFMAPLEFDSADVRQPNVLNVGDCPSTLNFGEVVACSIDSAAEVDVFTFNGVAGDLVRILVAETSGTLWAEHEVLRPDGTTLCPSTTDSEQVCQLESTGAHTLLIQGAGVGDYGLSLIRLNDPVGCISLSFDSGPISDAIQLTAEVDCYTFDGAMDDLVYIRVIETSGDLWGRQEVLRSDGTTLCPSTTDKEQICQLDNNGLQTLIIKGHAGRGEGNYSFFLMRLNNPVGCVPFSFDDGPISASIELTAQTDCYTFDGGADDQVRILVSETSGNLWAEQEVLRSDGTVVCPATTDNEQTCPLESNGGHTILIQDFGGTYLGDYQLNIICITPPCATTISTPTATPANNPPTPTSTPPPATNTPIPTSVPPDAYEPDNSCEQAPEIATDGTIQVHTFHEQADEDWVRFEAMEGVEYLVEGRVPPDSPANLILEAYQDCESVPESQDPPFSSDIRFRFISPVTGTLRLRMLNQEATVYGTDVEYHLSVRALDGSAEHGALIIVAGKYSEGDPLQSNIHHVTNHVYQLFRSYGHPKEQIYYLATEDQDADYDGQNDVNALPSSNTLQAAITQWAVDYVGTNRALTLFLMDHGSYDTLYLDGPRNEQLNPADLDSWLTDLENQTGVKVNILIEACNSGSFIDPTQTLSQEGRVIITATDAFAPSYASEEGAIFSDALLSALAQGMNLKAAFDEAVWAVEERSGLIAQIPWLNGDNNPIPNQPADYAQAEQRSFAITGSFPTEQWTPHIEQAEMRNFNGSQAQIWSHILDDTQIDRAWAVIYPPSYQPPNSSDEIVPEPPRLPLLKIQDMPPYGGEYGANWLFEEKGEYRIVIYAEDNERLLSRPKEIRLYTGTELYLPVVVR